MALSIKLNSEAAGGWQTNLAIAVRSLTGILPANGRGNLQGWIVLHPETKVRIEIARAGDWTVFGIARGENKLMDELIGRVQTGPDPFGARHTNVWLRLDADLNWLSAVLSGATNRSTDLPKLSARVIGDGGHVLTDGEFTFANPIDDELAPWTIPTGTLNEPLTSFTAIRGLRSIFTRLPGWSDLPLGESPDQAYVWTQGDNAFHLLMAAPLADAQSRESTLTTHLLDEVNPWLKKNGPEINGEPCPVFHQMPDVTGVHWGRMQGLQPFAQAVSDNGTNFLVAGLLRPPPSPNATGVRTELFGSLNKSTNLVYLGWEDTSARVTGWEPVLQTARAVTGKAPLPEKCLSLLWLKFLQPRLSETRTMATRTTPNVISFHRQSIVGLNAAELHLLADWLESPQFPRGLYTFLGPRPGQQKE
jgi:hypothetical protein